MAVLASRPVVNELGEDGLVGGRALWHELMGWK